MAGVSSFNDDPKSASAMKESEASYSHGNKARAEQIMNNPIYGYTGGAQTCWFNSALQMLLNTQKYREWIRTVISNPSSTDSPVTKKCFFLHTALKLIYDKEIYPFNKSKVNNRVIDINDFIKHANTIKSNKSLNPNAIPTVFQYISSGQQDPFVLINDITDCINYGTYQQQYINIYHNQSNNEIEWSKPESYSISSDDFIMGLIKSIELPSKITNEENIIRMTGAEPLVRVKSNEFTSLQQLLDIIPKPLNQMSRKTDQRLVDKSRFLSDLKLFSAESLYDRFNSVKNDKNITLLTYIDQVLTNLTTLYNKPRDNFSYGTDVMEWFKEIMKSPYIITTIHNIDTEGKITSTDVRFIGDEPNNIITVINDIINCRSI